MHSVENKSQECQMIWNLDTSDNQSTHVAHTKEYSIIIIGHQQQELKTYTHNHDGKKQD